MADPAAPATPAANLPRFVAVSKHDIPEEVRESGAKLGAKFTKFGVDVPAGLTMIGEGAFTRCTGLTHIALPGGLTTIRYGAFKGCTRLTHIALPDGLTTIEGTPSRGASG